MGQLESVIHASRVNTSSEDGGSGSDTRSRDLPSFVAPSRRSGSLVRRTGVSTYHMSILLFLHQE